MAIRCCFLFHFEDSLVFYYFLLLASCETPTVKCFCCGLCGFLLCLLFSHVPLQKGFFIFNLFSWNDASWATNVETAHCILPSYYPLFVSLLPSPVSILSFHRRRLTLSAPAWQQRQRWTVQSSQQDQQVLCQPHHDAFRRRWATAKQLSRDVQRSQFIRRIIV